jgi:cytidylate kinase
MSKIITISRQFGSGGRTIGKEVANRLNIPCYDKEIIERVAEESGFCKEFIEQAGEYAAHKTWFGRALECANRGGELNNQDRLWITQCRVIGELAEKGPCVIVGRCADSILTGNADLLKVFIHANDQFRAERIVKVYGEREDAPKKRLADKDKRRAAYYRFYTDTKWGEASNYDVALDSGALGIDVCAELIAGLYRHLTKEN